MCVWGGGASRVFNGVSRGETHKAKESWNVALTLSITSTSAGSISSFLVSSCGLYGL